MDEQVGFILRLILSGQQLMNLNKKEKNHVMHILVYIPFCKPIHISIVFTSEEIFFPVY